MTSRSMARFLIYGSDRSHGRQRVSSVGCHSSRCLPGHHSCSASPAADDARQCGGPSASKAIIQFHGICLRSQLHPPDGSISDAELRGRLGGTCSDTRRGRARNLIPGGAYQRRRQDPSEPPCRPARVASELGQLRTHAVQRASASRVIPFPFNQVTVGYLWTHGNSGTELGGRLAPTPGRQELGPCARRRASSPCRKMGTDPAHPQA
jgi:hypothetical protein